MSRLYGTIRTDLPDHADSCGCGWKRGDPKRRLIYCGFCDHYHCPACGEELPFKEEEKCS